MLTYCEMMFLFRWLIARNVSSQSIDKILEQEEQDQEDSRSPPQLVVDSAHPHKDQSTWFVPCDRLAAERFLQSKPEGTFLIRPRNEDNSFALSIV